MDKLIPVSLTLPKLIHGDVQTSGPLTILPLIGNDREGDYVSPNGLKLEGVTDDYGVVALKNSFNAGVAIVPLHIGYIQDQAQNHALCSSLLIGANQTVTAKDACCVQESQGGYLEEKEQWFFILPLQLREEALEKRGTDDYGKLWDAIDNLNQSFNLSANGHLEKIITRKRSYLHKYANRFELIPGQIGALFFLGNKLAGIELAPTAQYFKEVWRALVCFAYGVSAMHEETILEKDFDTAKSLEGKTVSEIKARLLGHRGEKEAEVFQILEETPTENFAVEVQEKYLDYKLDTLKGINYTGQVAYNKDRLVYASIFGRANYLKIH